MLRAALLGWLATERLEPDEVFLWMCFFINNQHRILVDKSSNGSDDLEHTFEANLERIGKVVALVDTWVDPVYLQRIWTIFEQFTAIKLGIDVTMILPPDAVSELMKQIERGRDGILLVKDHLSRVDSEHARASMADDEARVKKRIVESVGFGSVDKGITEFLIRWMASEVQNYMKQLIIAEPGARLSLINCASDTHALGSWERKSSWAGPGPDGAIPTADLLQSPDEEVEEADVTVRQAQTVQLSRITMKI